MTASGGGSPVAATPPSSRQRLTLLPPNCASGQLSIGRPIHDGGGGEDYTIFPLRLAHGRACTLWGTPVIQLTTSTDAPAPVAYRRRWFTAQHIGPVQVSRRRAQWFALAVLRCDQSTTQHSGHLVARLPDGAGTVTRAADVGYCGPGDPTTVVHVGAIGRWVVGRHPPPRRVALSMHSSFSPHGLATWGRGDLDGDGRPDLVIVRPTGRVSVRLASTTLHIQLPADTTARLQGLTDLTGDGRTDVLVASTALGCATGYRLCSSRPTVLTIADGQLSVVRFPGSAQPQWDNGHGDLFEGWICQPSGPTELSLDLTGTRSYTLTRTHFRVIGLQATPMSFTTVHGSAPYNELARLTGTRCQGLDTSGWAVEGPRH